MDSVSEAELQALYTWVDEVPLSRPKRNIARDFSDGVLVAEVIHHYFPRLVDLHNYSAANGMQQKMYNWNTLNQKVFKRLGFTVSKKECEAVANCQPGSIEALLKALKTKISKYRDPMGEAETPSMSPSYAPVRELPPSAPTYLSSASAAAPPLASRLQGMANQDAMVEKEHLIVELRETNEILETKVRKLEQLVRLKDAKIQTLMAKLQGAGMA